MSGSIVWDKPQSGGIVWDEPPNAPTAKPRDTPWGQLAALARGVQRGAIGNLGRYTDAYLAGPLLYATGNAPSLSEGINRAWETSKKLDEGSAEQYPGTTLAGRLTGAVGTGLAAGPALAYRAATTAGRLPQAQAVGSYLARGAGFGAATGATEGENLGERVDNAKTGAAIGGVASAVAPLVGKAVQGAYNTGADMITAGRNLFSRRGHEGIAGQMLREATGGAPLNIAQSPIPGLNLRTAQATGNPGIVGIERGMEETIRRSAPSPSDIVQGGRTPRQMATLADYIVPGSRGREPADLVREAGERGSVAVQAADEAITKAESALWAKLSGKKINAAPLADYVEGQFGQLPEYQRAVATQAGNYLARLRSLGEGASITGKESINGVRSDLLQAARRASTPDEANAYKAMASHILGYIERAPEIAGRPASVRITANSTGQEIRPGDVNKWRPEAITQTDIPAVPPDPATWSQWQAARDFTRQTNQATGYPSIMSLLNTNQQGNVTANPARAFGAFFPQGGGAAGVRQLEGVGQFANGAQLMDATRNYASAQALRAGRSGGQDAEGNPLLNPAAIARHIDANLPALRQTPTFAGPETTRLAKASEAAKLLARPQSVGRVTGSNTFEKLQQNGLLEGALGQTGAPLVGGAAGALAADYALPGPSYLTMPLGFAAGAMAGRAGLGPALNNRMLNSMTTRGAREGVERALIDALESPNEAVRLMAIQMLQTRGMGARGAGNSIMELMGRSAAPAAAHMGAE